MYATIASSRLRQLGVAPPAQVAFYEHLNQTRAIPSLSLVLGLSSSIVWKQLTDKFSAETVAVSLLPWPESLGGTLESKLELAGEDAAPQMIWLYRTKSANGTT